MNAEMVRTTETKSKILAKTRTLFARFGYEGTSIRDIARECDVNVAAINYHFKSKESLYWEVISESYEEGEQMCAQLAQNAKDLETFAGRVYDHFCNDTDLIRNTMKLFLSEKLVAPEDSRFIKRMKEGPIGPPGGVYFAQFLMKEMPFELRKDGAFWGVKTIFGTIVHWSTMCTTSHLAVLAETEPLLRPEQIRLDVLRVVKSTVEYMRNHPEIFKV